MSANVYYWYSITKKTWTLNDVTYTSGLPSKRSRFTFPTLNNIQDLRPGETILHFKRYITFTNWHFFSIFWNNESFVIYYSCNYIIKIAKSSSYFECWLLLISSVLSNKSQNISTGVSASGPKPASQSRVGKSFTFLIFSQIAMNSSYFPSNFAPVLPHFGPLGGRLAHPGRPWLRHCSAFLVPMFICDSLQEKVPWVGVWFPYTTSL